jgi:hypothetical protein
LSTELTEDIQATEDCSLRGPRTAFSERSGCDAHETQRIDLRQRIERVEIWVDASREPDRIALNVSVYKSP